MKTIIQQRIFEDDTRTLGTWTTDGFNCVCLELPDNNNHPQTSRIPADTYTVKKTFSPKHNDMRYEIINVPNRTGVRVDIANFPDQLLGCVAIGSAFKDISGDKKLDLINSHKTWDAFNEFMGGEDFTLIIKDVQPNT